MRHRQNGPPLRDPNGRASDRVLELGVAVLLVGDIVLGVADAAFDALLAELVDEVELVEVDVEGV